MDTNVWDLQFIWFHCVVVFENSRILIMGIAKKVPLILETLVWTFDKVRPCLTCL